MAWTGGFRTFANPAAKGYDRVGRAVRITLHTSEKGFIMAQRQRSLCKAVRITILFLTSALNCQFSVLAASRYLVVAALSPTSGSIGTEVTVTGYGFTPSNNTIRLGAGYINGLNSADGVTLHFTVPDGLNLCPPTDAHSRAVTPCPGAFPRVTPGSYSVSVLNANGASNDLPFTVIGN
jgi:hypothetical protein